MTYENCTQIGDVMVPNSVFLFKGVKMQYLDGTYEAKWSASPNLKERGELTLEDNRIVKTSGDLCAAWRGFDIAKFLDYFPFRDVTITPVSTYPDGEYKVTWNYGIVDYITLKDNLIERVSSPMSHTWVGKDISRLLNASTRMTPVKPTVDLYAKGRADAFQEVLELLDRQIDFWEENRKYWGKREVSSIDGDGFIRFLKARHYLAAFDSTRKAVKRCFEK